MFLISDEQTAWKASSIQPRLTAGVKKR